MFKKTDHKNQKGQALLFVIIALTISLAIGVGVSVRTISSLSRTTRTDTASRALAAAEGGIERYLTLSKEELDDAVGGDCPAGTLPVGGGNCKIEFGSSGDTIKSLATVHVNDYIPSYYPFELRSGEVKEVNLDGYGKSSIQICWKTTLVGNDILYLIYGKDSSVEVMAQGGITSNEVPPSGTYHQDGFDIADDPAKPEFPHCYTITELNSKAYGLRIRTLGGDANVGIYPLENGTLPLQGYEITSVGSLVQVADVVASRTITVVRSLPYLPAAFDFALYSNSGITK